MKNNHKLLTTLAMMYVGSIIWGLAHTSFRVSAKELDVAIEPEIEIAIAIPNLREAKKAALHEEQPPPPIGQGWVWPTVGQRITSFYGWRFIFGRREFHTGIDIANSAGTPIFAADRGTIVEMRVTNSGYGIHMLIDHHNGYWTLYAHLRGFSSGLKVGSTVSRGQTIGYMGCTGTCTGPHLHFEIRRGCSEFSCHVDPWPYIRP